MKLFKNKTYLAVDDDQRKEDGQQRDHAPPEKMENFTVIVWLLKNRGITANPMSDFPKPYKF